MSLPDVMVKCMKDVVVDVRDSNEDEVDIYGAFDAREDDFYETELCDSDVCRSDFNGSETHEFETRESGEHESEGHGSGACESEPDASDHDHGSDGEV